MTLNNILRQIDIENYQRKILRDELQPLLNHNLTLQIYRIVADIVYFNNNISYSLYDKLVNALTSYLLKKN